MPTLTEVEKRIVGAISQKGEMKQSELAAALSMDNGLLSRNTKDLEEEKGVIESRMEGKDKILTIAEGVEVDDTGEVRVPSGIQFPVGDKLQEILSRVMKGKARKNNDLIMDNFRMYQGYQTPNGLRALLMNWQIDAATQNVIVDSVFPGSGMGAQYGPGSTVPSSPYGAPQQQGYSMMYGQNGQPIIVMNPGYPNMGGGGVQPIILQQPGNNNPAPQPVIIDTGQKRRIQKPQIDKDGNIRKSKDGEVVYDIVEEPVIETVHQGGGNSLLDAVNALRSLAETGKTVGVLGGNQNAGEKSEKEKELEHKLEEQRKENEHLRDEANKKMIEDLKKDTSDNIAGMQAFIAKQQEELIKSMTQQNEINRLNLQHATEIAGLNAQVASARSSGASVDERLIDKGKDVMTDVVGGTFLDIAKMMSGGQLGGRPTLAGPVTSPQQAAADMARRMAGSV